MCSHATSGLQPEYRHLKKNPNVLFSMQAKLGQVDTKRFYSTRDVAEALGITDKTYIRNEKKGIFPEANRDPVSGYRVFTKADIRDLRRIYQKRIKEGKIQAKLWTLKQEPDVRQRNGKLTTRDVCVALGICDRTYVALERRGILPEAQRDDAGKRVFHKGSLAKLKKLYAEYQRSVEAQRCRKHRAN